MTDRELMQQALDAMLNFPNDISDEMFESIRSLRARLAQPEPEPWGYISHKSWKMPVFVEADDLQAANLPHNNPDYTPVYKAPPQREWQGLTDEELSLLWVNYHGDNCLADGRILSYERAIEAKLWEKNA